MRLARYKLFSPAPLRLGKWFGIDLEVYPSLLFLIFCYGPFTSYFYLPAVAPGYTGSLYLLAALLCSCLFICSLFLHELAHVLAARFARLPAGKISLDFFGGAAYLGTEPERPIDELIVALSGPLASIVVGILSRLLATGLGQEEILATVVTHIGLLNLALGLFNLLPGYPLDGGRALKALMWWYKGDRVAAHDRVVHYGRLLAVTLTTIGVVKVATGTSRAMGIALTATGLLLLQSSLSRNRDKTSPPLTELLERYYPTISPEASLTSFLKSSNDALPVVKGGRLYGILLKSDMLKQGAINAAEAMRPVSDEHFVDLCDSLDDALTKAFRNGTGIVAVLDSDGLYLGAISIRSFSGRSFSGRY